MPKITNAICASGPTMKQRQKVVPQAYGRVLEIGFGSGLNYGFYDSDKVDRVFALEPSEDMISIAKKTIKVKDIELEYVKAYAEEIPLEKNNVDTIIFTYTLCSIPNVMESFAEMRRVLKPEGVLLFCEHGIAPDKSVQKWQDRLNPVWKIFGGGCNLNRDIPKLITEGAFRIDKMDTMYILGFKPACYNYWGMARPRN